MNDTSSTPPTFHPRKRGFPPVILSAFVYPGIGQLAQCRSWAAGFFVLAITLAFFWLAVQTSKILVVYYNLAFNWRNAVEAPQDAGVLISFLVSLLLYTANVLDTALAQRRTKG